MTLNRELFVKDPVDYVIPNDGVSKLGRPTDDRQWDVLRYELTSFVCEGEYATGLQRVLDSYLASLSRSTQPAVWVSGFYGSGKSHLVRVLEHVWADTRFPDGATARGLVTVDQHVDDGLRELSTRAKQIGAAPWSAAGTLDTAGAVHLNLAFLAIVLRAAGLPERVAPARLRLWLREEAIEEAVVADLAAQGREVEREVGRFHLSVPLATAVLAQRPALAASPGDLLKQFKAQFPDVASFGTDETVALLREVLEGVGGGRIPPSLIVLDEVQQYINDDGERALAVQHLAEAVSSRFEGRVLLVATGQQELMANPALQKIQDRFSVKVHLRNQDVDQVVRQVLLRKEPAQRPTLETALGGAMGEISRQLGGSLLRHRATDDAVLVDDYPLLPARRRFWDGVLRQVDAGGRAGQLRSQLRVVHEANRRVAHESVGTVVGADFLYEEKSADMNASGRLLKETQLLIADQAAKSDGELRARILEVVHLVALLPTEGAADSGVRPTPDHIADLLVRDLLGDGPVLRRRVPELLAEMAREGLVQQHGQEFRLQTAEGREWEQDFRARRGSLSSDAGTVAAVRDQLLRDAVQAQVPAKVSQGGEQRRLALQLGDIEPQVSDTVPVWVRSEWDGVGSKQFRDLARGAGQDSPLIFVHLPRVRPDELRDAVLDLAAARDVLGTRAAPTTEEGRQARAAMESRRRVADERAHTVITDALAQATVELAGGAVMDGATLRARLEAAAPRAVDRLYPEFGVAADPRWAAVVKQLGEGNKEALRRLGYDGPVEAHPVTKRVLDRVGATWTPGRQVEDEFKARPYGWPHDAIRGAIGALVAGGHVTAQINGAAAEPKAIMALGARLGPLQLRREAAVITKAQEIVAKSLLSTLGYKVTAEPLPAQVASALASAKARASALSGPAPRPDVKLPAELVHVAGESGNAQVLALVEARDEATVFGRLLDDLEARRPLRTAALDTARRLARAAEGLDATREACDRLAAFEAGRDLLAESDGITPILQELAGLVRTIVVERAREYEAKRADAVRDLDTDPAWAVLGADERDHLLSEVGLTARVPGDLGHADVVLAEVATRPLAGWSDAIDSIPNRAARARARAVKTVVPDAVEVGLPGATLRASEDVDAYVGQVRARLESALAEHGVIVVRQS